jgi:hypothetical protein
MIANRHPSRRLRVCALLAASLVACAAFSASTALAAGKQQPGSKPTLKPLWSAFPLARSQAASKKSAERQPAAADDHSSGTLPLVGAAALAMLVLGGLAVFITRRPRNALLLAGGRNLSFTAFRTPLRPSEGGFLMSNARRRLWTRSESDDVPTDETGGSPQRMVERLSEYASSESRSSRPVAEEEVQRDEPVADDYGIAEPADLTADLAAVGDEVGAVLKSAQEAAATIRRTALEEAAKQRHETEAQAEAALAEARRIADAEQTNAQRVRADAEAYAAESRAAADEYANQRRAEAEREAAAIAAEAQSRLDAADAEVERKIKEAEAQARARVDTLEAEAERYEERLENLFVVFREMSSQLEELVGTQRIANSERAESQEGLEDILRPGPPTTRTT